MLKGETLAFDRSKEQWDVRLIFCFIDLLNLDMN